MRYRYNYRDNNIAEKLRDLSSDIHGTELGYSKGCNCIKCTDARNKVVRQHNFDLRNTLRKAAKDAADPRHGTYLMYDKGNCRCDSCVSTYRKSLVGNNVPSWERYKIYSEQDKGICSCG